MRCPYCHQVLDDELVKSYGASLMGQMGKGKAKRRSNSAKLAKLRWRKRKRSV